MRAKYFAFLTFVIFFLVASGLAQVPSANAYFSVGTTGSIPMQVQTLQGFPVYAPSELAVVGGQLEFNGEPLSGGGASLPTCSATGQLYYAQTITSGACSPDISDNPTTGAITMLQGTTLPSSLTIGNSSNANGTTVQLNAINNYNLSFSGLNITDQYGRGVAIGSAYGLTELSASVPVIEQSHFVDASATPTIVAGTGAGTSPTLALTATSTDGVGGVSLTVGTSPASNAVIATITANVQLNEATNYWYCTVAPANAATGNVQVFVALPTQGANSFTLNSGSAALPAGSYAWIYRCGEAQ
jgi:hypothetical protein